MPPEIKKTSVLPPRYQASSACRKCRFTAVLAFGIFSVLSGFPGFSVRCFDQNIFPVNRVAHRNAVRFFIPKGNRVKKRFFIRVLKLRDFPRFSTVRRFIKFAKIRPCRCLKYTPCRRQTLRCARKSSFSASGTFLNRPVFPPSMVLKTVPPVPLARSLER